MYDYGWRQYMPDLGRWYGMDQLSEKFHFASPYAYVLNNPLSFIDPDGRDINPTADGWEFTGADMQLLFKYLQGGNNLQAMVSSLAATDNFANNFNDSGISSFWSSFNSSGGGGSGWSGVSVKNGYATYWTNGAPASNFNFNDIQDMQESIGHRFRLPQENNTSNPLRQLWNYISDNVISKPIEGVQVLGYLFYGSFYLAPKEMIKKKKAGNLHVPMDVTLWGFKDGIWQETLEYKDGTTILTEQEKFEKVVIPAVEALTIGVGFNFTPFDNATANWIVNEAAMQGIKSGVYEGVKK